METMKEIEELNTLIALDHDAASVYESATKGVQEEPIRRHLKQFQDDHRRHVQELSQAVVALGGKPSEASGATGFATQGFTPVNPTMGTEGTLKVLKNNARTTNRYYSQARGKPFSAAAKAIIERGFQDERGHLAWIEKTLQDRSWEGTGARP